MRMTQVAVTGVAVSAPLPLDPNSVGGTSGLYLDLGAGCTASVEITPDNIMQQGVVPVWFPCGIAALTAATVDAAGGVPFGVSAVRINQTAGAASTTLKVVSQGIV